MIFDKIKISKIAIVVFLTVLIWVWADLALDETLPVSGAMIIVDESTPSRWVTIGGRASAPIDNIVLKGPLSRISDVRRKIRDRPSSPSFEFFLDVEQEGIIEPNEYPSFDVRDFLRNSDQIRRLGFTVESCKPANLNVKVVGLFEKSLPVQCFDISGNPLKHESIDPATVSMFVPEAWGRNEPARVTLTAREIELARENPVGVTPYIELPDGQRRKSRTAVNVRIPPEEDRLKSYNITTATPGFLLGANLQGKYEVQVSNPNVLLGAIQIRATEQAKLAYEQMDYQVVLQIVDEDAKSTETIIRRDLIYNFPPEYVLKGEIELVVTPDQPAEVQFKLVRLPSADNP
ncbi:MAG: hypothetical protein ACYTAO_06175 [Planctomycetota bacterium]|jgi:hypothetical protein